MTSMYKSASAANIGSAGITRDYQMIPKSPDFSETYNEVITPTVSVVYERPSYVILNKADTFNFLYTTTCSIGGTSGETFKQGAVVPANGTPLELPIQPHAWSGGATGDVTFVYVRVR